MTDKLLTDIFNPAIPSLVETGTAGKTGTPDSFARLLGSVWSAAIVVAGIAFLIYMILGALQWITAGGDKAALDSAKSKITNGFVGLLIIIATFAIIKIVQGVFGINILNPIFPTPG